MNGEDGDPGLDGFNTAETTIYRRSETEPTTRPRVAGTYTFATGALVFPGSTVNVDNNLGTWSRRGTGETDLPSNRFVFVASGEDPSLSTTTALTVTFSGSGGIPPTAIGTEYDLYIDSRDNSGNDDSSDFNALTPGQFIAFTPSTQTDLDTATVYRIFEVVNAPTLRSGTTTDHYFMNLRLTEAVGGSPAGSNEVFTRISTTPSNGWETTIPLGSSQLWRRRARAISRTATDTIPITEWSDVFQEGVIGADGQDARTVRLTASDQSIVYDTNGANPSPSSITLTATSQNFNNTFFRFTGTNITDETTFTDGTTADSDTFTFTVPTTITATNSYTVQVDASEGDQTRLAFDTLPIPNTPNTCLLYTSPSPRD